MPIKINQALVDDITGIVEEFDRRALHPTSESTPEANRKLAKKRKEVLDTIEESALDMAGY